MLSEKYQLSENQIASKEEWQPYPSASQRQAWESLPEVLRAHLVSRGEAALAYEWKPLLATRFMEYARIGNRSYYEQENFERRNMLIALALAECVENKGRFVDQIVNGIWLVCEETYWGLPAHVGVQRSGSGLPDAAEPTVDLFAAETASALAYIQYLLPEALDAVSPLIRQRIADEIQHRILIPNQERDDFKWMGFQGEGRPNNWNPWVNSNWLACVLFIEENPVRRRDAVNRIMRSLDRFIDPYPADGGCDEGPGYWLRAAGSMFDCLEQLDKATHEQVNVFHEPLIQEMGRFIYRVHIDGEYYINFADASGVLQPEASLIYRYGQRIEDPEMSAFGAWTALQQPDGLGLQAWGNPIHSPMRLLGAIFSMQEMTQAEAYAPLPRDIWLPHIEVMAARDEMRSGHGFYVAAKGGHNNESHNHNDIGEFIVFINGQPLLVDAGVETYSRKTFSPQRYEIWTMQSIYHNLPTIDGVQQQPGEQFAARDVTYESNDSMAQLSLNIAGAYPPEAGIKHWQRTIKLHRGQDVEIVDDYALDHMPKGLSLSLLTPSDVSLDQAGKIDLSPSNLPGKRISASGAVYYDADLFIPSAEVIQITDGRMVNVWGTHLNRITLVAKAPHQQAVWTLKIKEK